MRKFKIIPLLLLLLTMATSAAAQKKTQKTYIPWDNGKLVVSEEGRYLKHENGAPFFWLGETGWLLPERLNRDEAEYYLEQCKRRGKWGGYTDYYYQYRYGIGSHFRSD